MVICLHALILFGDALNILGIFFQIFDIVFHWFFSLSLSFFFAYLYDILYLKCQLWSTKTVSCFNFFYYIQYILSIFSLHSRVIILPFAINYRTFFLETHRGLWFQKIFLSFLNKKISNTFKLFNTNGQMNHLANI